VNWQLVLSIVGAIGLGAFTNELCDLAPWFARQILKHAARIEACTRDEADLIYAELVAILEEKPGKLSKLGWSLGRMAYAARNAPARPSRWNPRQRWRKATRLGRRTFVGVTVGLALSSISIVIFVLFPDANMKAAVAALASSIGALIIAIIQSVQARQVERQARQFLNQVERTSQGSTPKPGRP
jgi:hypothetical protein